MDAPSNPGSSPITAYYVTDGGFSSFGADTLTGTTLRCLLPDTEYFVAVQARNDHGYSPWSERVSQVDADATLAAPNSRWRRER